MKYIINEKNNKGLTPIYLLCQRGYNKKFSLEKQNEEGYRAQMINLLINGPDCDHITG